MVLSDLSFKLREKVASKWLELNFSMFLSFSIEVLRHIDRDSNIPSAEYASSTIIECIAEHLEELTSAVTEHCNSPVSLKDLLKIYTKFAKMAKTPETLCMKVKLVHCVPKLFLCESQLMVGTFGHIVEAVREDEGMNMEHSLYRTIARRVVLFLMQYAILLDEEGNQNTDQQLFSIHTLSPASILNFEATLMKFSHQCGFELPALDDPAGVQAVRHTLFQLLNEQDDAILEMLTLSSKLWK